MVEITDKNGKDSENYLKTSVKITIVIFHFSIEIDMNYYRNKTCFTFI